MEGCIKFNEALANYIASSSEHTVNQDSAKFEINTLEQQLSTEIENLNQEYQNSISQALKERSRKKRAKLIKKTENSFKKEIEILDKQQQFPLIDNKSHERYLNNIHRT